MLKNNSTLRLYFCFLMFYKLKYNPEFEAHQNEKEEGVYESDRSYQTPA